MSLLLEADPAIERVQQYLMQCRGFIARDNQCYVGTYLLKALTAQRVELMNIAVLPDRQQQGIGSLLLNHALSTARAMHASTLELGTGTFGHQLAFYQRAGFRVVAVEPDYFLQHYPEPLFEQGIQHRDRLLLRCNL